MEKDFEKLNKALAELDGNLSDSECLLVIGSSDNDENGENGTYKLTLQGNNRELARTICIMMDEYDSLKDVLYAAVDVHRGLNNKE